MGKAQQSKAETLEAVKGDFRNLLHMVWMHAIPGRCKPTPLQNDIALYLQHGPDRAVVEAHRGIGKSWITAAFVCWCLLRDPNMKVLVVSASKVRSDSFSTFVLRLIREMPILRHLQPGSAQRDSRVAFDVGPTNAADAPTVRSVGITGNMTGARANLIIADDVEVMNNSDTQQAREKLWGWISEFSDILSPGGRILFLGTPQSADSIYPMLHKARGFDIRIWPARYPNGAQKEYLWEHLAPIIKERMEADPSLERGGGVTRLEGQPIDDRFNEVELQKKAAAKTPAEMALQYQLDTSQTDAYRFPLKLSDLLIVDPVGKKMAELYVWSDDPAHVIRPETPLHAFRADRIRRPSQIKGDYTEPSAVFAAIDPSGRGLDETVMIVGAQKNGYILILEVWGTRNGYGDDTLVRIAKTCKKWNVSSVFVEENFGQGMFEALLVPHLNRTHRCKILPVRQTQNKERRICETLAPVMQQHRLLFSRSALFTDTFDVKDIPQNERFNYEIQHQITRMTEEKGALKHDDRVDCLAMLIAQFERALGQDAEYNHEAQMEASLKALYDRHFGTDEPTEPTHQRWWAS